MTTWDAVFASREWGRWPNEAIVRRVSGLPVRPCESRALELGCGPGAQLWYLERTGYRAVGCDLSAIGLRQAAGRLREEGQPPRLALADCSSLPFATDTFDVILDVEAVVYNHEARQAEVWAEVSRTLAPGGRFVTIGFTATTHGSGSGTWLTSATATDLADGPLAGPGILTFVDEDTVVSRCATAELRLEDVQFMTRTMGPERWVVEELVAVAIKP